MYSQASTKKSFNGMISVVPTRQKAFRLERGYGKSLARNKSVKKDFVDNSCLEPSTSVSHAPLSISSLLDDSFENRAITVEKKEAIIDFLSEQYTYLDEILEYALSSKKSMVNKVSDSAMSDFAVLEIALEAALGRVQKQSKLDNSYLKKRATRNKTTLHGTRPLGLASK